MGLGASLRDEIVPNAYGSEVSRFYPQLDIGPITAITDTPRAFDYPDAGSPCFVTRVPGGATGGVGPESDVVAFSATCPHLGCRIDGQVDAADGMVGPCPCHFSCFDLRDGGHQTQGQAPESLPRVILEVKDGRLLAVGVRGLLYGRFENLK